MVTDFQSQMIFNSTFITGFHVRFGIVSEIQGKTIKETNIPIPN